MLKFVLFDIDGTLIRSGGAGVLAFEQTFRTQFQIEGATKVLSFPGRTDTSIAREFFERNRIAPTKQNFARCLEIYPFWLDHILPTLAGSVLPGVKDFIAGLAALDDPPILGLLTGNIRLGAEIKLRHFNLWEHFALGAFGDDHEDRNCLAKLAAKRARVRSGGAVKGEEIMVIGDTSHDIACGQCIGAKTLAVATGPFTKTDLEKHQPDWAVHYLHEWEIKKYFR